ncbi:hypothetical protein BD779DRAFT_1652774 [Infundibulicybe gibba]|nr:hypothetical protein BD779DRAFT_1652774 [Infundibulicybe gibba]
MADIILENYSIPPSPLYPLHILANRYSTNPTMPVDGYTLIFFHAIGAHKECWDIVIRRLFELTHTTQQSGLRISDAFVIDSPNHGKSGMLNRDILSSQFHRHWPTQMYSRAVHIFLTARTVHNIDFFKRRLVAVGHSFGAAACFLVRDLSPRVPWEFIIAIEAGISPSIEFPNTDAVITRSQTSAWLRPDTWPTIESAQDALSKSPVFRRWDPRAFSLYIKHGLGPHPASCFQPPKSTAITTALLREQEAAAFESDGILGVGTEAYRLTAQETPVHLISGGIHDFIPLNTKEYISNVRNGMTPASSTYIQGAGHMVCEHILSIL